MATRRASSSRSSRCWRRHRLYGRFQASCGRLYEDNDVTTNSAAFQFHFSYMPHTTEKVNRVKAPLSQKRRFPMHDIEQQPSQDDSTVEVTDIPRQEEQQMAGDAGLTPMTIEPEHPRRPSAMRLLAAGGIVLLVLAMIFSVALFARRPSSQPGSGTAPAQNQSGSQPSPTATPASSSTSSSQFVSITIAGGVAYAGADRVVSALRASDGTLLWHSRIDGAVGDQ